MNRIEFIEKLRQALAGELTYHLIDENINYYEEYIDMELRSGKSEEEVLRSLGDPRLLAKTIIETNKADSGIEKQMEYEETENTERRQPKVKSFRIPGWLIFVLVIMIGITLMSFAASLFVTFLPYILLIMFISFVVKSFRNK